MKGIQVRKSPPPSIVDFLAFGGKPVNVFVSILRPSYQDQVNTIYILDKTGLDHFQELCRVIAVIIINMVI